MNTESLRNEVLVPAVAKTLDIATKAKPTKEELFTTAKITAAVAVATAVVYLAVQAVGIWIHFQDLTCMSMQ